MSATYEFSIASALLAPVDVVWSRVVTPEGINHELAPWLRMPMPRRFKGIDPRTIQLGTRLFRSWLLFGGVIPVDYDDLVLVSLDDGHGFHERSSMATARVWEHRRSLHDDGAGGCVLTDRVSFEPRYALASPVLRTVVPRVFTHRHRRLRAWFGGEPIV